MASAIINWTWLLRTRSKSALVYPRMHILALIFELGELVLRVVEFVLEVLNLVLERPNGVIEGLRQWVRGGLHAGRNGPMRHVTRGHRRASGRRIVPLITGGGRTIIGLQSVLRIETAGVLSVFVGRTLMAAGGGWVV